VALFVSLLASLKVLTKNKTIPETPLRTRRNFSTSDKRDFKNDPIKAVHIFYIAIFKTRFANRNEKMKFAGQCHNAPRLQTFKGLTEHVSTAKTQIRTLSSSHRRNTRNLEAPVRSHCAHMANMYSNHVYRSIANKTLPARTAVALAVH